MKLFAMTDVGCKRSSNQDAFCQAHLPSDGEFMVLCDGMGGHRGGNVASAIAVRAFRGLLFSRFSGSEKIRPKDLKILLEWIITGVSRLIAQTAAESSEYSGMGSTVVLALRRGKKMCIAHVGDSRAYLYRNGALRRLTRDHSLVQDLIDRGEISPEEGVNHPHRNVITRTLGYAEDSTPEIQICDVRQGDLFLLCSDGLTVTVPDNELEQLLQTIPPQDLAPQLIARAREGGGPDNVTVGILYEEESEENQR